MYNITNVNIILLSSFKMYKLEVKNKYVKM